VTLSASERGEGGELRGRLSTGVMFNWDYSPTWSQKRNSERCDWREVGKILLEKKSTGGGEEVLVNGRLGQRGGVQKTKVEEGVERRKVGVGGG